MKSEVSDQVKSHQGSKVTEISNLWWWTLVGKWVTDIHTHTSDCRSTAAIKANSHWHNERKLPAQVITSNITINVHLLLINVWLLWNLIGCFLSDVMRKAEFERISFRKMSFCVFLCLCEEKKTNNCAPVQVEPNNSGVNHIDLIWNTSACAALHHTCTTQSLKIFNKHG